MCSSPHSKCKFLFKYMYILKRRRQWQPTPVPFPGKILWTEEPGRLQSMELPRVGHDWATSLSLFTFMHWKRKWQPTPVFLSGESEGWRSLVVCHLWGRTEWDTTGATYQQQQHILKMFQSTTFMWIWKQYFSECLWPSTCLHLNHYYRHSWKLKKM